MIQSDVDIFCLQEVYEPRVQRKVRRDLKNFYPYALSAIDLDNEPDSDELACDSDTLNTLFACLTQRCPGVSGPEQVVCGTLR